MVGQAAASRPSSSRAAPSSGAIAYLVMPLMERPHLWVWRDGVMVTVTGDLTRDQMLDVANSLEPLE